MFIYTLFLASIFVQFSCALELKEPNMYFGFIYHIKATWIYPLLITVFTRLAQSFPELRLLKHNTTIFFP